MPAGSLLQVRELDRPDIDAFLARHFIGRIAFLRGGEIDVLPIQYVYSAGSIYARTAPGGKLNELGETATPVSFEVDEIQSSSQWRSVLVHGTFQLLSERVEREEYLRALGLLRRFNPATLKDEDPAPHRNVLFRILVRTTTGRAVG